MSRPDSNSDDALKSLINKTLIRRSGRKADASSSSGSATKSGGLKPSAMLFLPADQKKLISYLSRQRIASFTDMQQTLVDMKPQEILDTLVALKGSGYINESLHDGEIRYRIKFAEVPKRIGGNLPKELQDALNLDNATFMAKSPLFKELTGQEIKHIKENIVQQHYERSDVILWQGESSSAFFMIKNGVVAVTNVSNDGKTNLITYLEQGDFFGESSLLIGQPPSATITAFTPVDILIINQDDFLSLITNHSGRTLELAKIMAHRLAATNVRMANKQNDIRLFFVISAGEEVGATTIASALALTIAYSSKAATAYLEFPRHAIPGIFGFPANQTDYAHPGDYHVLNPSTGSNLSQAAQLTLLMEQLNDRFKNIVVCIKSELIEELDTLLRNASQIAVVSSHSHATREHAKTIIDMLKFQMQINKTHLLSIANQSRPDDPGDMQDPQPEFVVPFMKDLPPIPDQRANNLPGPLRRVTEEMVSRLGFTSQIGIYIPTTLAVDQQADTSVQVNKTLEFMGKIFGGATHEDVHGVWNSSEAGLVTENIHLVRSFCTQTVLDERMGTVIDYVETMKKELQQEAMAIEVNQKLMLI